MFIDAPPFLMEGPYLYSDLFCDRFLQSCGLFADGTLFFISGFIWMTAEVADLFKGWLWE